MRINCTFILIPWSKWIWAIRYYGCPKLLYWNKRGKIKEWLHSFFMSRMEKGGWKLEKIYEWEVCCNKLKEWFLGKVGHGNQGLEDNRSYSMNNIKCCELHNIQEKKNHTVYTLVRKSINSIWYSPYNHIYTVHIFSFRWAQKSRQSGHDFQGVFGWKGELYFVYLFCVKMYFSWTWKINKF